MLELCQKVKSELAGCVRAASDGSFPAFPCGVTAFHDDAQSEEIPQNGTHKREEPAERMFPFVVPAHKAKQQVRQQGSPDLPAHCVLVVAEEICKLERLLDFLEEHLDAPAALVELADGEGRSLEVVGDEGHFNHPPLDFHIGGHQPEFLRIMLLCAEAGQPDALV